MNTGAFFTDKQFDVLISVISNGFLLLHSAISNRDCQQPTGQNDRERYIRAVRESIEDRFDFQTLSPFVIIDSFGKEKYDRSDPIR